MKTAILIVAVLFMPALAFSTTIHVPDDYATKQQAIDASANKDTSIVDPGTYFLPIRRGKTSPPDLSMQERRPTC